MNHPERLEKSTLPKLMKWMCGSEAELKRLLDERDTILFPDLAGDDLLGKMCPFIITDSEHDQFLRPSNRLASRLKRSWATTGTYRISRMWAHAKSSRPTRSIS